MKNRTNRVLTIVFAVLLLVNVGHLLAGFASIPRYLERVTTLTIPLDDIPSEIIRQTKWRHTTRRHIV